MKKKEDLFILIHAMTKSEKRYFSVQAQKNNAPKKGYLALFKAISQQSKYNEAPLKQQFGESLGKEKNYLYENIMKSMREYHNKHSILAQARNMLLDAKILYERNLYDQAQVRLRKAYKIAQSIDASTLMLDIIKEERKLIHSFRKNNFQEQILALAKCSKDIVQSISVELDILDMHDDLFSHYILKKTEQLPIEQLAAIEEKYNPLLSCTTSKGKIKHRQLQSQIFFHTLKQSRIETFECAKAILEWWDAHPSHKKEDSFSYIVDYFNYINTCFQTEQYDLMFESLNHIDNLDIKEENLRVLVFEKSAIFKLNRALNLHNSSQAKELYNFSQAKEITQQLDQKMKRHTLRTSSQLAIWLNGALLLFFAEAFTDSQQWLTNIIKTKKVHERQDIQIAARILHLFISIELTEDGDDALKNIGSINRYLHKNMDKTTKDSLHQYTVFARKLITSPLTEQKLLLDNLSKAELPLLTGGINEAINIWATSKYHKKKMSTIIKERAEQSKQSETQQSE